MRRALMVVLMTASFAWLGCGPPAGNDGGTGGGAGGGTGGGGTGGGGAVDTTPPLIVSVMPGAGSTGVTVQTGLVVQFSEAMSRSTVIVGLTPSVAMGELTFADGDKEVSIAPTADLAFDTVYTIGVEGLDLAGNALAGLKTSSFTTAPPPDVTAPTVTAFSPSGGAVSVTSSVSVTFSEPMNGGSVSLAFTPAVDLGVATWNGATTVATWTPAAALLPSTTYSAALAGEDPAGNALTGVLTYGFTTAAPPDTTPPTVASISPTAGQTNVSWPSSVAVEWSEPMDKPLTQAAFTLRQHGAMTAVTGTFLWDGPALLMTFDPAADLLASTVYDLTITVAAKDLAGNALAAEFTSSFTTAAAPDTIHPTIVSVSPASGSAGVPRCSSRYAITFSEAMDRSSVQASVTLQQTSPAVKNIPISSWLWNGASTVVTAVASSVTCFDYNSSGRLTITAGANDQAGNAVSNPQAPTYTIIKLGSVTLTPTLDGYLGSTGVMDTSLTFLPMGDNSANTYFRSYLSFSLAGLPATAEVTSASLRLTRYLLSGAPFVNLGALLADHVDFGPTMDGADFTGALVLSYGTTFATADWSGARTVSVVRAVQNDLANRVARGNRSQFRLKFTLDSSANAATDMLYLFSANYATAASRPQLLLSYEYH